jgi:hypothetical protein
MRTLLPLGALLALSLAGCSDSMTAPTDPTDLKPAFACAGNSGNCGGGGSGQHNNNSNNPPATAP